MKNTIHFFLLTAFAAALAVSPSSARADDWFECEPAQVVESSNRVHVQCSSSITEGSDVITYLAISKTDSAKTARFISLATSALLSAKIFRVLVPTSSATNTTGCDTNNCRTPVSYGLKN